MGRRHVRPAAPLVDKFDVVGDVRGQGLMIGVELWAPTAVPPNAAAANDGLEACQAGRLARRQGRAVRQLLAHRYRRCRSPPRKSRRVRRVVEAVRQSMGGGPTVSTPVITHWVDGKPWEGTRRAPAPVFNPATGEVVPAVVSLASDADVDAAVQRHGRRFREWRRVVPRRRAPVLVRVP